MKKNQEQSDEDGHNDKINILEDYRKDYTMMREEFDRLIVEEAQTFEPAKSGSKEGERMRLKFKNLLIDHANIVLRTYRTGVVYKKVINTESNVQILPDNPLLHQKNDLLQKILAKAVVKSQEFPATKMNIPLEIRKPSGLIVVRGTEKVKVEDCLPKLPIDQYEHRVNNIVKRQKQICDAYRKLAEIQLSLNIDRPQSGEMDQNIDFQQQSSSMKEFNSNSQSMTKQLQNSDHPSHQNSNPIFQANSKNSDFSFH